MGSCPVCRKVFHSKDFEHVLGLVGLHSSELSSESLEIDTERLVGCDSEKIRRANFEAILKLQEENNGLIEPKKDLVVLPGMYLSQPVTMPTQTLHREANDEQERGSAVFSETDSARFSSRPSSSEDKNLGRRKQRVQNMRKSVRQWVRKENGASQ